MRHIKAPYAYVLDKPSIFLAGSIEMGTAKDWQTKIVEELKDENIIILNPRRNDWNSSWEAEYREPSVQRTSRVGTKCYGTSRFDCNVLRG